VVLLKSLTTDTYRQGRNHGQTSANRTKALRVFNFRSVHLHAAHLWCCQVKLPNLKLKTWPKQLLGSLPLDNMLPTETVLQKSLFHSSFSLSLDIAELLLENGADPNATNRFGKTPMFGAFITAKTMDKGVRLLVKFGGTKNVVDNDGRGCDDIFSNRLQDMQCSAAWTRAILSHSKPAEVSVYIKPHRRGCLKG
jgi:hypothetical protein